VPFDGAFSPLHWLIVAVVALLVLGPDQLPGLARRAGEFMRDLRRVREHLRSELRDLVSEFDLEPGSHSGPLHSPEGRGADANGASASD
jgi:TatA/E family protein of Tat protein translocase